MALALRAGRARRGLRHTQPRSIRVVPPARHLSWRPKVVFLLLAVLDALLTVAEYYDSILLDLCLLSILFEFGVCAATAQAPPGGPAAVGKRPAP